jgi:hypothetical protein
MTDTLTTNGRWTIDRRVPLALLITGIVQFGGACAGGAVLYATVNSHSDRLSRLETAASASLESLHLVQIDITRISAQMQFIVDRERRQDEARR